MGYLFLGVALTASIVKGYCGKTTSRFMSEYTEAFLFNMIRMTICVLFGAALLAVQGELSSLAVDLPTLLITMLSGVTTSVFVVTWLMAVKNGAYMMLDAFLMLGVLVTILCSFLMFGEPLRPQQAVGLLFLLAAVLLMCSYNNAVKKAPLNLRSIALLVLCGTMNGLTDFSQKMFTKCAAHVSVSVFNFYTFVFSALTLLLFYAVFRAKNSHREKSHMGALALLKPIFGYMIVMALCQYVYAYFKTLAAAELEAAVLYPLNQGCSLLLSGIMAAVMFKERLTGKCLLGMLCSFVALLFLNL